MNDHDLKDPDEFSAELHFALLTEGLKGPSLRRMMRVARTDPELARIFETKVSELRHFLRTTRKPTLLNLPVRIWERLSDNVRFTPPKEVFLTLIYVGLAMTGFEFFKQHVSTPANASYLMSLPPTAADFEVLPNRSDATVTSSQAMERIERWMIDELQRASKSKAWKEALAKQLAASIEDIDLEPLLLKKLEDTIRSREFTSSMHDMLQTQIDDHDTVFLRATKEVAAAPPAAKDGGDPNANNPLDPLTKTQAQEFEKANAAAPPVAPSTIGLVIGGSDQ